MRTITEIIIHCSATPEGKDYTVEDIDRWHKARGWRCIGYHYVVYRDGSVHEGRPIQEVGAHCTGRNAHSIGICYIGGLDSQKKPKDTRTEAQKAALLDLLKEFRARYPGIPIKGHRDYSNKACPCFDAHSEYKDL